MIVAVFDVDGVVADVRHRLHHIDGRPKDWHGFFAAAALDPPLPEGARLARQAAESGGIVWLTGRPERLRGLTLSWLALHGLPAGELLMRPDRDRRPARTMKRDCLRKLRASHDISLVVDDDPEVIAMVEAECLPARLADWVPRSVPLRNAQQREGRT